MLCLDNKNQSLPLMQFFYLTSLTDLKLKKIKIENRFEEFGFRSWQIALGFAAGDSVGGGPWPRQVQGLCVGTRHPESRKLRKVPGCEP